MKAVVAHDFADFRLENVPIPEVGPREILMKITYSGICGGDKSIYYDKAPWDLDFPYIPGHEFVGEIAQLGKEVAQVSKYAIGDRITAEMIIPCHECQYCASGKYNLCDSPKFIGSMLNGGWAEYMIIPEHAAIYKIPDGVSQKHAAIAEPLSCSLWAVEKGEIGFSDVVIVSGLGPIGLGAIMGAKLKNPQMIIALDIDERLFPFAKRAGADFVFNPSVDGFKKAVQDVSEIYGGPSVVIEASGSHIALMNSIDLIKKGGRVVVYGVYGKEASINWSVISEFKELTIVGGHLAPNMLPVSLNLLEKNKVDPDLLISHVFELDDFELGITYREKTDKPVIKALLKP